MTLDPAQKKGQVPVRFRIASPFAVATFLLMTVALASPERGEEKIAFADAPAAVQATIRRLTSETIAEVEKSTDDGTAVYEAKYGKDATACSVKLAASGEVMETEQTIDASKLPEAVRAAITKKFPKGEVGRVESVTTQVYEVLVNVDGKKQEIKVLASGQVKGGDEDEHDEGCADEDGEEEEGD